MTVPAGTLCTSYLVATEAPPHPAVLSSQYYFLNMLNTEECALVAIRARKAGRGGCPRSVVISVSSAGVFWLVTRRRRWLPCARARYSTSFCAPSNSTTGCGNSSLIQRLVADPVHQPAVRVCAGRQLEVAVGLFVKELEVAAGPFVNRVVAPVCKDDGVCAIVLPPAQTTGRARLSCWRCPAARSTP